MKSRIKNALKHEVEVAGRSVSVLVLLAVFLAGSGGAALLSTFGTVSGSANINQAFTVDGKTGQGAEVVETVALTGGESVVTNHNFRNNLNQTVGINVTSMAPEELSLSYRFVDNLVATTEYSNFDDEQANVTGNMTSEFAYNPVDDKVGVHAYGQTVYKEGSRAKEAESYAGLYGELDGVKFQDSNELTINYSIGNSDRENLSAEDLTPLWIRYYVNSGDGDLDRNGEMGETWVIENKSIEAISGQSFQIGDTYTKNTEVYKKGNQSVTVTVGGFKSHSVSPKIEALEIVSGSGPDDAAYVDVWFYDVEMNVTQGTEDRLLREHSGNFTRTFDSGATDGAVIAEAKINAYGTGISYSADFNPITN